MSPRQGKAQLFLSVISSAAESRDLVSVHGLFSYTRFPFGALHFVSCLRLKAASRPSGRNDKSAQFNSIWYNLFYRVMTNRCPQISLTWQQTGRQSIIIYILRAGTRAFPAPMTSPRAFPSVNPHPTEQRHDTTISCANSVCYIRRAYLIPFLS